MATRHSASSFLAILTVAILFVGISAIACGGRQCRPATVCTSVRCSKSGSCVYTAIRSNLNRTCQLQLLDGQLAGGVCRLSPDPSLGAVCENLCVNTRCPASTFCNIVTCDYMNGRCYNALIRARINLACIDAVGNPGVCVRRNNTDPYAGALAVCSDK